MQEECIPFALEGVSVVAAQMGESLGDLASIMAALYALDIEHMTGKEALSLARER